MNKKIICIILVSFFIINIGTGSTLIVKSEKSHTIDKLLSLNKIKLDKIKGEEEKLKNVWQTNSKIYTNGIEEDCVILIKQYKAPDIELSVNKAFEYVNQSLHNRGYENFLYITKPDKEDLEISMREYLITFIDDHCIIPNLFIYMIGHGYSIGKDGYFELNPGILPKDRLKDDELGDIIDNLSSFYSNCTIVIESCFSGCFIDDLSGRNRVIITATDHKTPSQLEQVDNCKPIFTVKFFEKFADVSNTVIDCWEYADEMVYKDHNARFNHQNPQYDDNGNGYSVGLFNHSDKLPMDDGHTENESYWDGNFKYVEKSNANSKNSNRRFINNINKEFLQIFFKKLLLLRIFFRL